MARLPPRITKVLVERRRPPNQKLRPLHRQFINALPCCVCGRPPPSDCAHLRISDAEHPGSGGGTAFKPPDRFCVPLCHPDHLREGTAFWAELEADPMNLALRLWTVTGDIESGLRAIQRFRQSIVLHRAPVTRVT